MQLSDLQLKFLLHMAVFVTGVPLLGLLWKVCKWIESNPEIALQAETLRGIGAVVFALVILHLVMYAFSREISNAKGM